MVHDSAKRDFPLIDSGDNESLQFPAEYNVDIHMGELNITSTSFGTNLYSSMFVSNISKNNCLKGFCTSPSSFLQPVYGEFLFDKMIALNKSDIKLENIDQWYSGGMAGPNWEGLIKGATHIIRNTQLELGQRYRLTLTFIDPYDDYILF